MMRTIMTIALAFLFINVSAQNPKMMEALGKTMAGYGECRTAEDFEALSLRFKRVADAEGTEWLPRYYQAHALIIGNFSSKAEPLDRDLRLDEAQSAIDQMTELVPGEVEVVVLQAMLYTARLVIDPQTRGQEYGAKSAVTVGRAMGMDPNNPRAQYMNIANEQGTAQFFGKDLTPYCDQAKVLLDRWEELNAPATPLHPKWGKDQCQGIADSCSKKKEQETK